MDVAVWQNRIFWAKKSRRAFEGRATVAAAPKARHFLIAEAGSIPNEPNGIEVIYFARGAPAPRDLVIWE